MSRTGLRFSKQASSGVSLHTQRAPEDQRSDAGGCEEIELVGVARVEKYIGVVVL